MRFEGFVREAVALVEERLRRELPVGVGPLTELSLGVDQGKLFYRWAVDDLPADVQKIVDAPAIDEPPLPPEWEARDWSEAWGQALADLAVVAAAAALVAIRDGGRLPIPFSVNCNVGVYDDVEDVRGGIHPSSCDPFAFLDADAAPAVEALFDEPATLAWVRRLATTDGPLTLDAVDRAMRSA